MLTSEGLGLVLDIVFGDEPKPSNLYVGLIDATGYSGISENDTMASHSGWTELEDYDEVTRPEITFGNPSAATITNPTAVEFTPSSDSTCVGYFITTSATKGGSSGDLYMVGLFAEGTKNLIEGIVEAFTANISDANN